MSQDRRSRTERGADATAGPARAGGRLAAGVLDLRSVLGADLRLAVATVVGLVVACGCGALIATLVDDVSEQDGVTAFDHDVLRWMVEHRSAGWTRFARTVTHLGDPWVIVAVTTIVSLALFATRRFRLGGFLILATSGAAIASSVAKQAIDRSRPPEVLWLGTAWGPAFPSGHSTQSVACYGALAIIACVLVRRPSARAAILAVAAVIALLVGTSRMYLAVHWCSDVLCGWAIGSLWLSILVLVGWSTPRWRSAWIDRRGPPSATPSP